MHEIQLWQWPCAAGRNGMLFLSLFDHFLVLIVTALIETKIVQ